MLCPHCSKFACELCLKSWISEKKGECPRCRKALAIDQVVKVRFLGEIAKIVDDLGRSHAGRINKMRNTDTGEICDEHQLQMVYYCVTCLKSVCSDCGMFSKNH